MFAGHCPNLIVFKKEKNSRLYIQCSENCILKSFGKAIILYNFSQKLNYQLELLRINLFKQKFFGEKVNKKNLNYFSDREKVIIFFKFP